jgi:hypothetical protein
MILGLCYFSVSQEYVIWGVDKEFKKMLKLKKYKGINSGIFVISTFQYPGYEIV